MAHKLDIQLFTTPVCPNCPAAKAVAAEVLTDREGVNLTIINAFEARDLVARHGLQAVPSFIVNGCLWMTGIPSREQLEHLVATGWECKQASGDDFHHHGPADHGHDHGGDDPDEHHHSH